MIDEVLIMAKKNKSRGRYLLKQLSQQYKIYKIDMGDDAHLSRKGFVFDTRTYKEKIEAFAQKLAANGGSAVNMFTKLFGQETADRMVIHHMYGA